jgi:cell division protein FtsQ
MTTTQRPPVASRPPSPPPGRRRRTALWAGAGAVVLCLALGWLVAFSPVLGVGTVSVRGTHLLTVEQVRSAAALQKGSPLIRLDTAAAARRVQRLPEVASASVNVSYPSSVVITVVERVAVGYLSAGGRFVLVDRTGDQFRTVPAKPRGLPRFDVASGSAGVVTGRAVADVAAALPASVRARLASIQALDPTSITLQLTDSRVIRWGSDERNADKARILPALLTQQGTQFDLTDPDQVIVR